MGGGHEILPDQLELRYETACDPRLNRSQALDLAFMVAEVHRTSRTGRTARAGGRA